MFSYIKKLIDDYSIQNDIKHHNEASKIPEKVKASLSYNLDYFKKEFDKSADLTIRKINISGIDAAIITIEGMVNKETLANSVTNPIMSNVFKSEDPVEKYEYIRDSVLSTAEQVEVQTFDEAFSFAMSGFALVLLDGSPYILAIGVQGFPFRGVSEPTTEVMNRGSREGFVEPLRINMTLIRRRMKNPKLKFETMKIGSVSKTEICLCYLRDTVSQKVLEEIRKRLRNIDLETVMASGYISPFLENKGDFSLFNSTGTTERPDTLCGKLAEGGVGILVDGTPNAIIAPYLFVEYFQNMDDYTVRPYFATFTRWLKYLSFGLATILPGLYVAVGTFNPELFPDELLNKIAKAIAITPFPLAVEALLIHFIYEIMREAGLRLPKPLGHAVSIVGALVIGDTAISAGLIGATTLMILAITAISSYVIPRLYEPVAVLRLFFIIVGGIFGVWGVLLLLSVIIVNLCAKESFSIPFMSPVAPFGSFAMRDVAVRASWKVLSKKVNTVQDMPGSNIKS